MKICSVLKILLLHISIIGLPLQPAHGWECEVTLDGPNVIKVGQTITLSASGTPEGGSYSWSATPNLVPAGSTAQLTGFKPESSEYIWVTVKYTSPSGKKCSAVKGIWVCICYVKITGPTEAKVSDPPIILTAASDPSGGIYEWSDTPGLVPNGPEAQFTPESTGDVTIEVTYTAPGGETCSDTHIITVFECSVSISGPSEVAVGDTITLTAEGDPLGGIYEWSDTPGLVPNGPEAQFTAQNPGDVTIDITYTSPEGRTCNNNHTITVFECLVFISGPQEVNVCESITLTAEGDPPGGTYSWTPIPGLEANGEESKFTGQAAGDVSIEITYTTPEGKTCSALHSVIVSEECPTLEVPLFKQYSSPWDTDTYDHMSSTIRKKGCALTSAVMVLRYYGVVTDIDGNEVNPRNLNEWLRGQSDGYNTGGNVNWWAVVRYSGERVLFNGLINKRDDNLLNNDLCNGRAVMLNVPAHFVVAMGMACADNEKTWSIRDPGYNITKLKDYGNTYIGLRRFRMK